MEQSYFRGAGGLEAVKFLMPMASTWQGSGAWQAVVLDPLCVYLTQCQDLNHMLSSLEKLFLEGLPQISPMFPWPYSWEKLWRECLMHVMVSSVLVTKQARKSYRDLESSCCWWNHGIHLLYTFSHLNWGVLVTPFPNLLLGPDF